MSYKEDFPIFKRVINGKPLVYLDSAATTQKPGVVIDALKEYYENYNANTHRGIYKLSEESTELFENARKKAATFIAGKSDELVFTKSTTESLNAIAQTTELSRGDEIVLSILEHHSNLMPWQELAKRTGARLRFIDIDDNLELKDAEGAFTAKTKVLAITGMSNVTGLRPDVRKLSSLAHDHGAVSVVDAAQLVAHSPVDVKSLGCDFLAAGAHKMLGPYGVGILWARQEHLENRRPFLLGGGMVKRVTQDSAEWDDVPLRFEAGTSNVAGVYAFGKALDYLSNIGMGKLESIETELTKYAIEKLSALKGITLYSKSSSIISFTLAGIHPHDVASVLDTENVCVRAGHHCAMPLMQRLGVPATLRASFHIYNEKADIDILVEGLKKSIEVFG